MKSIRDTQKEFIETYRSLGDTMMQYEFLLQIAGETPAMAPEDKNEETQIRNCQTDSWLSMRIENSRFYMSVDSDSLLIRGILSVYVYLLNGRSPHEIIQTPLNFIEAADIRAQLSLNRFTVLSALPETISRFCMENMELAC